MKAFKAFTQTDIAILTRGCAVVGSGSSLALNAIEFISCVTTYSKREDVLYIHFKKYKMWPLGLSGKSFLIGADTHPLPACILMSHQR